MLLPIIIIITSNGFIIVHLNECTAIYVAITLLLDIYVAYNLSLWKSILQWTFFCIWKENI